MPAGPSLKLLRLRSMTRPEVTPVYLASNPGSLPIWLCDNQVDKRKKLTKVFRRMPMADVAPLDAMKWGPTFQAYLADSTGPD